MSPGVSTNGCAERWNDASTRVKLSSVQRTLTFKRRYPTKEEVEWAESVQAKRIKPMSSSRYSTYSTVLAYASPEMPPTLDVVVQTHRIGDLAVAAMPFEEKRTDAHDVHRL